MAHILAFPHVNMAGSFSQISSQAKLAEKELTGNRIDAIDDPTTSDFAAFGKTVDAVVCDTTRLRWLDLFTGEASDYIAHLSYAPIIIVGNFLTCHPSTLKHLESENIVGHISAEAAYDPMTWHHLVEVVNTAKKDSPKAPCTPTALTRAMKNSSSQIITKGAPKRFFL